MYVRECEEERDRQTRQTEREHVLGAWWRDKAAWCIRHQHTHKQTNKHMHTHLLHDAVEQLAARAQLLFVYVCMCVFVCVWTSDSLSADDDADERETQSMDKRMTLSDG